MSDAEQQPRALARHGRAWRIALGAIILTVVAAVGAVFMFGPNGSWTADFQEDPLRSARSERSIEQIALETDLMAVSEIEAEQINSSRPNDLDDVDPAAPFAINENLRSDPRFLAALDCLSQAIYYEAASESEGGQRAVAQVVLNRVRHPAFPQSVCGVVYQGSHLSTGCQFTFTCDGSLARQPSIYGWARARRIALAALSGWVEEAVGTATHYHASFVVPYWAGSLDKIRTIGAHIFYMMPGRTGSRIAFNARYDMAAEVAPPNWAGDLLAGDPLADDSAAGFGLPATPPVAIPALRADMVPLGEPEADGGSLARAPSSGLLADERSGDLIAGQRRSELLVD